MSFSAGRITEVTASSGVDEIRAEVALDEGASYLGEVALVDETSRVGRSGITFWSTLFDENASSHIALGTSIVQAVPWAHDLSPDERNERGLNQSSIHTDFMIGSRELDVWGVGKSGQESPILRKGDWQLAQVPAGRAAAAAPRSPPSGPRSAARRSGKGSEVEIE
jgi:aminopeptidase